MSNYVYLEQLDSSLPLLDKELIYADVSSICYKSSQKIIVDHSQENIVNFYRAVHTEGAYPRFKTNDYCYKINPDYDVTPVIDLSLIKQYDFETLTDSKSLELKEKLEKFERVYVFWSGGIDSTLILSAIFKNWNKEDLDYLVVVHNQQSIAENFNFYKKYIEGKIKTISSDLFFSNQITFNYNSVYVTGDCGDAIICYSNLEKFNNLFPDIFYKKYKDHSKEIIKFFGNDRLAYYSYKRIVDSFKKNNLDFETVFDFLWWLEFNWAYSPHVYTTLWSYCLLPQDINSKEFMLNNMFNWFNDIKYQHWAISSAGTSERIHSNIQLSKYVYKKYIYDFDKNLDYFLYKTKVGSIPLSRNIHHGKKVVAIDKDWTLYYR